MFLVKETVMKRWFVEHSLSLVLLSLFVIFLVGQSVAGVVQYNEDQKQHGDQTLSYSQYLVSPEFIEATFENWESEFLQMGAYVILTVFLFQKGSAESKKLKGDNAVDADPLRGKSPNSPWPVHRGGVSLTLYKNSLGIAFMSLFIVSLFLHAYGGALETCQQNIEHGQNECMSTLGYMTTSQFWFESFQNWQSEFLAIGAMVIFTIYLRQQGSPESKPVATSHYETGTAG